MTKEQAIIEALASKFNIVASRKDAQELIDLIEDTEDPVLYIDGDQDLSSDEGDAFDFAEMSQCCNKIVLFKEGPRIGTYTSSCSECNKLIVY